MFDQDDVDLRAHDAECAESVSYTFPSQLFTDEDEEDNRSYVRGYN